MLDDYNPIQNITPIFYNRLSRLKLDIECSGIGIYLCCRTISKYRYNILLLLLKRLQQQSHRAGSCTYENIYYKY
jgi:hypothetical protein